jgi:hypothetical protein
MDMQAFARNKNISTRLRCENDTQEFVIFLLQFFFSSLTNLLTLSNGSLIKRHSFAMEGS